MARPRSIIDRAKDLELLARIAAEPGYRWDAPPMGMDEPEYESLERLRGHGLVSGGTRSFVAGCVASCTYRLTQEGIRVYERLHRTFEKTMPTVRE